MKAFLALMPLLLPPAWAGPPCPQPSGPPPAVAAPGVPAALDRLLPAEAREAYSEMLRACATASRPLPTLIFHARMAGVDVPNEKGPGAFRGFVYARLDARTGELKLQQAAPMPDAGPSLFFGSKPVVEGDAAVYARIHPHSYSFEDGREAGAGDLACAQAMARTLARLSVLKRFDIVR